LARERACHTQRIHKALEDANITCSRMECHIKISAPTTSTKMKTGSKRCTLVDRLDYLGHEVKITPKADNGQPLFSYYSDYY
jgi:hypothetical protein